LASFISRSYMERGMERKIVKTERNRHVVIFNITRKN
jgi:hypothetical protein